MINLDYSEIKPGGPLIWTQKEVPCDFSKPVVLFDRDDTLIHDAGQTNRTSDLSFRDGALDAISQVAAGGFNIAVVTNQAGLSKGLYSLAELTVFHNRLFNEISAKIGVDLLAIVACPHKKEDACLCRKPQSGMILALQELGYSNIKVIFGNSDSDIKSATNIGIAGVLISEATLASEVKKWIKSVDIS